MALRISIIVSLSLLAYVYSKKFIPSRDTMTCPNGCECYYLGINWQTDCSDRNMTTVPSGIDANVYTLIMDSNRLVKIDPLPSNIKVRSVQLSNNSLSTIKKETFAGLKYLLDVGLSSNLINYVHPEAFIENPVFITFQLQNNPLKLVEGPFLYSKTLRFLYLANCQLTAISNQFFAKINSLIKVDLSGNPLRLIEAGVFDSITNLKHLIFNNCNLIQTVLDEQHHIVFILPEDNLKTYSHWILIIGKLLRLEHLELKQSGLSNLPENVFSNHIYLRRLVLAENQLSDSSLDTTLGQNLANIDYLDLSYCNLKAPLSKYVFAKATKLRTLILSGNYLSTSGLGEAFSPLSKLVKLSLNNCRLTEFPSNTFQNLINLKELDISMNPLNSFFSGALSIINRLDSLERLNMSYTSIDEINGLTVLKMTRLKSFILSGNKIKTFKSGFLNNLPSLVLLELNNCGLGYLDSTLFYDISEHPVLEELSLSENPIQRNGEYYFKTFLPKLRSLDLSYCNLTWFYYNIQVYTPSLNRLLLNNNKMGLVLDLYDYYERGVFEYLDLSYNYYTVLSFKCGPSSAVMPDSSNMKSLNLLGNPWICDCSLVSLWEWANHGLVGAKNDLVGSNHSKKETDNLVCTIDPKTTPREGLKQKFGCCPPVTNGVLSTLAYYVRSFKDHCLCLILHNYDDDLICFQG